MNKVAEKAKLTPQNPPVSQALILICEKCGNKLSSNPEQNPARMLQSYLKEKIKAAGKKGQIRAAITSCMDLCPKGEIAIAISRTATRDEYFSLVSEDTEEASRLVLQQLEK